MNVLPVKERSNGFEDVFIQCKEGFHCRGAHSRFGNCSSTQAAVILPEKSGFSGYFNLGVGGVSVESNMLASIMSGNLDVGDKEINNFTDSPNGSEGGAIPVFNFQLSYTFASTGTQLHVGNLLEEFLSFDTSTIAGVRQDVGRAGLVGASLQATSFDTQLA